METNQSQRRGFKVELHGTKSQKASTISLQSSGFLRVIGPHSCVTAESLLHSLPIEGHCVWSKSAVFWDAFTAVSVIVVGAFWDDLPCTSSSSRRFGEYFASNFRVPQGDMIPQMCCRGIRPRSRWKDNI
jgi:hypothetical protein